MRQALLIGDIGGTNARLALVCEGELIAQRSYSTRALSGLEEGALRLLSEAREGGGAGAFEVRAACFGVAGPTRGGRAHLTNVGWGVDQEPLARALSAPTRVVNDLYAQAAAIPHLSRAHLTHLCGPEQTLGDLALSCPFSDRRPLAVLGAGTGLGEALLIPLRALDPSGEVQYRPFATEGGHARFAPRNETEVGFMRWLQGRHGEHVSVERAVSGPGLLDLFTYLGGGALHDARALPPHLTLPLTPEQITRGALEAGDELCARAIQRWVELYADEAANLALKCDAEAVFLTGGLSAALTPALHAHFQGAFLNKGRYRELLSRVSVWLVTAPDLGLVGAERLALELR
jgi:glucokinase